MFLLRSSQLISTFGLIRKLDFADFVFRECYCWLALEPIGTMGVLFAVAFVGEGTLVFINWPTLL
jgi:hypothetical protein